MRRAHACMKSFARHRSSRLHSSSLPPPWLLRYLDAATCPEQASAYASIAWAAFAAVAISLFAAMVLTRRGVSSVARPTPVAFENPLIVRTILLQAAAGDPRDVGRLAQVARVWWEASNGSVEQDDELYVRIAEGFGWGPGIERIKLLHLLRGCDARDMTSEAKQFVRSVGLTCEGPSSTLDPRVPGVPTIAWAPHVYSIEAVGGLLDEFYGEMWVNQSKPKFVTKADPVAGKLPPKTWPGCKLGLTLLDEHGDPTGGQGLIFNVYVPHLSNVTFKIDERPGGDHPPQEACSLAMLPHFVVQQLAWAALDAPIFEDNSKCFLKDLAPSRADAAVYEHRTRKDRVAAARKERPFGNFVVFACTVDSARAFTRQRRMNTDGEYTVVGWRYLTTKRLQELGPPRRLRTAKNTSEEDKDDE